MSTKKIAAGDTLTVGDLTDDHLGAFIEVGNPEGIHYRMMLGRINTVVAFTTLVTERGDERRAFSRLDPVTVITPPPVVQPDEPTILGQCIRIKGDEDGQIGLVIDPDHVFPMLWQTASGAWIRCPWGDVLVRAGDRQIVVSDPPRWPDETPEAPEYIEGSEWPEDDENLRFYEWVDKDGDAWWWCGDAEGGGWRVDNFVGIGRRPCCGPWTRGERIK